MKTHLDGEDFMSHEEMGVGSSLLNPSCAVPLRNYIDIDGKMEEIAVICGTEHLWWSLGFTLMLTIGLFFIQRWQKAQDDDTTVIPDWLVCTPLLYGLYLIIFVNADNKYHIETERVRFLTSGIEGKKEFLAVRSAEDARAIGVKAGLTNAAIIAGSGLYGPFWRGY